MFNLDVLPTPRLAGHEDIRASMRKHLDEGVLIMSHRGGTGFGATTLARQVATEALPAYPQGCIEINLRGSDPNSQGKPTAEHIHRRVLKLLDPGCELPEEPRVLRKRYLKTLAACKVLLIFDDVASALQLRALLPRGGAAAIVIAQTDLSASFPRLHTVTVDKLAMSDVYSLMMQRAPERIKLSRRAIGQITNRLEGVPLALKIATSLLGQPNLLTLRKLNHSLELAQQRILALRGSQTPNTPVDIALEMSYDLLDFDLKQSFEALAIFPAPFTKSAAAAVWGIAVPEAEDLLEHFSRLALVEHHGASAWYEIHQRIQIFAQDLLLGQADRSEELVSRYVGHYLRSAVQAGSTISTLTTRVNNQKLDPYAAWDHIPTAWRRLNGEDPGWPKPPGMDRWIRDFPLHSRPLLDLLLSRTEYLDWLARAFAAAEDKNTPHMLSSHLGALGRAYADIEEHNIALTCFKRQIAAAQNDNTQDIEAEALMDAGSSYDALGQTQSAGIVWREALAIFERIGDQRAFRARQWLSKLEEAL